MSEKGTFVRLAGAWSLSFAVILIVCFAVWRAVSVSEKYFPVSGEDIAEGYIVKLSPDGEIVAPGWSANVGDTLGLALSAQNIRTQLRRLAITDVHGDTRHLTPPVALRRQEYKGLKPWLDGAGFDVTAKIDTSTFGPGLYFVADSPYLFFVLNDEHSLKREALPPNQNACCRNIAILIGTNTFNAYATTLGRSLYSHPVRVPKVSFYRPMHRSHSVLWLPLVKWVANDKPFGEETNITFLTDWEMDDPRVLDGIDVLMVVGHPEYWTRRARETFDGFVARGGHVIIAGGNALWWQARYEGDDRSVLVSYKTGSIHNDPLARTPLETTNWHQKRLDYPIYRSTGADFKKGGFGKFRRPKEAKGWGGYIITQPNHPLFKGTGLTRFDCLPLLATREWDGAPLIGFDSLGLPVPDRQRIGAYKYEILGFELGHRVGHTLGTMSVMQRTPGSGYVLHFGSKDLGRTFGATDKEPWRSSEKRIKQIMVNFVEGVRKKAPLFSDPINETEVAVPFHTPWKGALPVELETLVVDKNRQRCSAS